MEFVIAHDREYPNDNIGTWFFPVVGHELVVIVQHLDDQYQSNHIGDVDHHQDDYQDG